MKNRAHVLRWLVPAVAVYAVGFALAAVWDLAIDQRLYSPNNLFAILMECFGWYPAFLPALFLALLGLKRPSDMRPTPLIQRLACGLVALGGFAGVYYASYGYLVKRGLLAGPADFSLWLWLAAGVLFVCMLGVSACGMADANRYKMGWFCLVGTVFMVANQALVYPIKLLWGRVRFDDMLAAGSLDAFTPWYQPLGPGGSSFPSGHTANAAVILVLLVLCDLYPAWAARRRLVTVVCWGTIVLMAFARILIGRHFLSDTLAASGLMALLYYALVHNKYYRRGLEKTLERARAAGGEASDGV